MCNSREHLERRRAAKACAFCGGKFELIPRDDERDRQWLYHVHRHHPSQDEVLHEKFYSAWHRPDNPTLSCCNNSDCYSTEIQYVDGKLYARRREDGKYILIPSQKIERNRDNPDGRNHLCAPPPALSPTDTLYCFALGGAT